jgi:hypothetical protein
MLHALVLAASDVAKPSKVPFYICGGLLALWAVVLGSFGISRPDFPGDEAAMRGVIGITLILVAAALTTAVVTA